MVPFLPLMATLGCSVVTPTPHDASESLTQVDVGLDGVRVRTSVQTLSLLEVIPELDVDGDGLVLAADVERCEEAIRDYLALHQAFRTSGGSLALQSVDVQWLDHDPLDPTALGVAFERWSAGTAVPAGLEVEMDLFLETSPLHRDFLHVRWPDGLPQSAILDAGRASLRLTRPPSLRRLAAEQGLLHGLRGAAVWLVVGLLLAASSPRGVLVVFASACVAGALVHRQGVQPVDARILSLAFTMAATYLGADVALQDGERGRWVEALLFGGLAGLTVATFFEQALPGARGPAPLTLFATGVFVPGAVIGVLLRRWPGAVRWFGGLVALVAGALFAARTFGAWPPGL